MAKRVGVLNIPGRGSSVLTHLGGLSFGVESAKGRTLSLGEVRVLDRKGLIAWYSPGTLDDIASAAAEIPVEDEPLITEQDAETLGDRPDAGEGAGGSGHGGMRPTARRSITRAIRTKLSRAFSGGEQITSGHKALHYAITGLLSLAAFGLLIYALAASVSLGSVEPAVPASAGAMVSEGPGFDAAEKLLEDIGDAIKDKDRGAYDLLVDLDGVAASIGRAYAARLASERGGIDEAAVAAVYASTLVREEAARVESGKASGSVFSGNAVSATPDGTGVAVTGGISFGRVFLVSGGRVVSVANAEEMAEWLVR